MVLILKDDENVDGLFNRNGPAYGPKKKQEKRRWANLTVLSGMRAKD